MLRVARSRKRRNIRDKDGRGRAVPFLGGGADGVLLAESVGLGLGGAACGECGENVESFCSRGRSA
jgi:hypothetical protein